MSYYTSSVTASVRQYGIRTLLEQLGVDSLNPPVNTLFRIGDGYNATLGELLVFLNGMLQDTTALNYAETDERTLTMNVGLNPRARLLGINVVRNTGEGGLIAVDRPPAFVGGVIYQTSQPYGNPNELMVFMNGQLLIRGVGYATLPPNQFSMLVPIPPGAVFVTAIVNNGAQGLQFRETNVGFGAFPAIVPTVNFLDKNENEFLVFINGQLQAENFDYHLLYNNQVVVTRVIPGANDIEIIGIRSSHPSRWRS